MPLKIPRSKNHGQGEYRCTSALGIIAAAVTPPGRSIRWGVLRCVTTMDISCCYSLPTFMIRCRAAPRHRLHQFSGANYNNHRLCLQRTHSQRRKTKSARLEPFLDFIAVPNDVLKSNKCLLSKCYSNVVPYGTYQERSPRCSRALVCRDRDVVCSQGVVQSTTKNSTVTLPEWVHMVVHARRMRVGHEKHTNVTAQYWDTLRGLDR